jgi:hypothetical protein
MAHGLRFHLWQDPNPDGSLDPEKMLIAAEIGRFVRERSEWCVGNESIAEIAIFASRKEHLLYSSQVGSRQYWPGERRVRGMFQILREGHMASEIVHDHSFLRRMNMYKLVILPETQTLYKETAEKIESYVRNGGSILIIGKLFQELIKVLGSVLLTRENDVADKNAGDKNTFLIEKSYGKGKIFHFPSEIISEYVTAARSKIRNKVLKKIRRALDGKPQICVNAPSGVEIVMNRRNKSLYVHFVNHIPGKIVHEEKERFFDDILVIQEIKADIRLDTEPKLVVLMPNRKEVGFSRKNGYISVDLPPLKYHYAIKIS